MVSLEEQKAVLRELINQTTLEQQQVEEECEILFELVIKKRLRNISDARPNTSRGKKRKVSEAPAATSASATVTSNNGATPKQKRPKAENTDGAPSTGKKASTSSRKKKDPTTPGQLPIPMATLAGGEDGMNVTFMVPEEQVQLPSAISSADLSTLDTSPSAGR